MAFIDNHGIWNWTEEDTARLREAFQRRFGEPLPRTETLFCVAMEGIRIAEEMKAKK